jgi:hypothetical protein
MPLIANPNVRDPMSVQWSPVQSGPPTPVAGPECLPAATKFKRDNQLLGAAHSSSGLFTPLEGSGSSSPSPSDTATPEDPPVAEVEPEIPAVKDNGRHREGQATSMVALPVSEPPEIQVVESTVIHPEGCDWGEVPRLSIPPVEVEDHAEGTPAAVPAARVFFQPAEPGDNVDGFDARSEASPGDGFRVDDNLLRKGKQCQDARGSDKPKPSTVAPGALANDSDASSISSPSSDEKAHR